MKKFTKIVCLCMIMSMLVVLFSACSPSKEDVAGIYEGIYTYNGSLFKSTIVLDINGNYYKITVKNGEISSENAGKYGIEGREVILYSDGELGGNTPYKYKKDVLVNNKHEYKKISDLK